MPDISFAARVLRLAGGPLSPGDTGHEEMQRIVAARDEVIPKYRRIFSNEHLPSLTEEEFRGFLNFGNNHHWRSLDRLGSSICQDMLKLRGELQLLLDEKQPIRERLNHLVPPQKRPIIPRLSRAVLTPILLISFPEKYGVWNKVSEDGMKSLDIWPDLQRGAPFADRYERMNSVLKDLAQEIGVDLWTLDALWWRVEEALERSKSPSVGARAEDEERTEIGSGLGSLPEDRQRFGLERHLHEFLHENWQQMSLGTEWKLYEEDGEEVGFEYRCDVGRIDLLAKHKTESRWLVIELKRGQSSDQTVGQLTRYMGWVKRRLAEPGDSVEGLIISHESDQGIRFALSAVPDSKLKLYDVKFELRDPHDED
jgi:Endonuclease NucS C-terminal domain